MLKKGPKKVRYGLWLLLLPAADGDGDATGMGGKGDLVEEERAAVAVVAVVVGIAGVVATASVVVGITGDVGAARGGSLTNTSGLGGSAWAARAATTAAPPPPSPSLLAVSLPSSSLSS
jgi:hypothetical protein